MPYPYVAGDILQLTATFTDAAGAAIDPSTVTLTYSPGLPGTSPTTLTYAGATQPAVGIIAKTATGVYVAQIDTTGAAGTWTYQWKSTGTGQACAYDTVDVLPAPL